MVGRFLRFCRGDESVLAFFPARSNLFFVLKGRRIHFRLGVLSGVAAVFLVGTVQADERLVEVGAAKVDVTPGHPVVLAGYGGRRTELEGIDTRLWARAMVIGNEDPVAIVVLDNCGVPAALKARLAQSLSREGIVPERLVVAATHTHNAPSLVGYARVLWAGRMTPEQEERMARYTDFALEKMAQAVRMALQNRQLMHLSWGQGRADFGGNRRIMAGNQWRGFGFQRGAPVDHSLPVLAAKDRDGRVRVLWANYACHCTTVGGRNHVSGDWAGFANDTMEEAFPSATTLMTIGCGADIGPQPSGNLQIAERHGRAIGGEVQRLLGDGMSELGGAPAVAGTTVQLPLEDPKPRAYWEELKAKGGFDGQLGIAMLKRLDAGEGIPSHVPYPVTSWQFGKDLAMVFLPGEVVVDYSVRLNRELAWSRLWITAWANGMPGYIPSRRVLAEGGYEADFSQVYYEQPGRYKPEVEEVVVGAVHRVVGKEFAAPGDQKPAPFHRAPSGEDAAFGKLSEWAGAPGSGEDAARAKLLAKHLRGAKPAIRKIDIGTGESTMWHNLAGDFVERVFIRQEKRGAEVGWESKVRKKGTEKRVLCFSGGVGWSTEPKTGGFALVMDGEERLRFDVTNHLSRWSSEDDSVELFYLPTWNSDLDTGGFFFLVLGDQVAAGGGLVTFSVRSVGEGSKRWFAIDSRQEIARLLPRLMEALKPLDP